MKKRQEKKEIKKFYKGYKRNKIVSMKKRNKLWEVVFNTESPDLNEFILLSLEVIKNNPARNGR